MGQNPAIPKMSTAYIKQMMEWGFDKEFIARDAGISVDSLEMRLRRARKREQANGNQGTKSGTSSDQSSS